MRERVQGGLWDGPRGQDERGMSGYAALTRPTPCAFYVDHT